jgi:hypothetical protein
MGAFRGAIQFKFIKDTSLYGRLCAFIDSGNTGKFISFQNERIPVERTLYELPPKKRRTNLHCGVGLIGSPGFGACADFDGVFPNGFGQTGSTCSRRKSSLGFGPLFGSDPTALLPPPFP